MRRPIALISVLILVLACSQKREAAAADAVKAKAASQGMTITSSAFAENQMIPVKYGCAGASISPPLAFSGVPKNAKSLALVVEDPDAPGGLFTHWVVWNIPASSTGAAEGHPPDGGVEGQNSYGKSGYGTLCPPSGEHRYVFNLYALDSTLNVPSPAGRDQLESAMKGHVVAQAQLMGRYRK